MEKEKSRGAVSRVMSPLGVRRHRAMSCHLSLPLCLHAAPERTMGPPLRAAYPPAMDEPSLTAGIFGLATHRTCGLRRHRRSRWALTPPFHPYPDLSKLTEKSGAVVFCHVVPDVTAGWPLASMPLWVARTFLPTRPARGDRAPLCIINSCILYCSVVEEVSSSVGAWVSAEASASASA